MGKRYVVSADTGEILNTMEQGDRILRKKSEDKLSGEEEMKYSDFAILNTKELRKIAKELDIYESGFIVKVIPYVSYITCVLRHRNGKSIGTEDLADIVGLSRNKTYAVLSSLICKGVLLRQKSGRDVEYCINPYIVYKGRLVQAGLKERFRNYSDKS